MSALSKYFYCFYIADRMMALISAPKTFSRLTVYRTFIRNLSERAKQLRSKELLDKIIRVDHAGELGAKRIYQGQLAVLGNTPSGPIIEVY